MEKKQIIIIGGGFAGVKCAWTLSRHLSRSKADIILFNRQNHLVFSPLLAEVVGSSINSLDVIVPLRQLLPNIFCRTEDVRSIQFANNEISFQGEDGHLAAMRYDHLVIACGNATNLNVIPGMADQGFPLKTVADAAALRAHIMDQMEQAEVASAPDRRRWHLTFLVVGGGYSGVEAAGEINDLVRGSARYFRNWQPAEVNVCLIHSRAQILPEISPGLRDFAKAKMERAGVRMELSRRAAAATPEGVILQDGRVLKGATIVCTIGSSGAPLIQGLKLPRQNERLVTDPDMRIKGLANVWAIGDCAVITNTESGQPSPTTGQFAEREGRQCAENILRALRGEGTRPFRFKQLGELCSIGGHSAVADLFGMHLSGFVAWFVWRGIYLFKLPTWGRRLQVGFDWAWLLVFPRDLAHVRTEQTDRVSRAHYAPGDFIFRRGEAPTNFYVLQEGEVEVLRSHNGANGETVAVLGPGSFFGERALLGDRPRVMSVRARTPVEVLVMGKNVFTQISGALAPLRDALAQSLNRRTVDIWKEYPHVQALMERTPVRHLMEPSPEPMLKPQATLRDAGRAFIDHGNEFFYVSGDGITLEGIVTITDLIRGRSLPTGAATLVSDFMTRSPVTVAADDSCAVAANAIREYRLKNLPVVQNKQSRKVVGSLRLRCLMAFVFRELGNGGPGAIDKQPARDLNTAQDTKKSGYE
jgi:NADH:ubiquinone reductase (H+-translocating)